MRQLTEEDLLPIVLGTVRQFDANAGYGFIRLDGSGEDIFVHHSDIIMDGFRKLDPGERVSFKIRQTHRGPKAVKVAGAER